MDHLALSWLCAHTIRGVEFCSAARDPPPRCHPGTRGNIIYRVQNWLNDRGSKQRVLFLRGPAGVGKSAIAQSLADHAITDRQLSGATLFFDQSPILPEDSRPPDNESSRLWTTVSYRLATKEPSYRSVVLRKISGDPKLVEQSMTEQFRSLIAGPIGQDRLLDTSPHFIPIFIDGLDQSYDFITQQQVLQLIFYFVGEYPNAPLVWIITSRPDSRLLRLFDHYDHLNNLMNTSILEIDSEDARKDVRLFFQSRFTDIQRHYQIKKPVPWPGKKERVQFYAATSGLFIFAYAILCFIEDRDLADPVSQSNIVLSTISPSSPDHLPPLLEQSVDPLRPVHAMYTQILRKVPQKHYRTARRILGFFLLPNGFGCWARDSTTFWDLCNILNIDEHVAYACLSKLSSVFYVPKCEDATHLPARFLHSSFANYLINRHASGEFWIDMREVTADLWHCHWRALKEANMTCTHRTILRRSFLTIICSSAITQAL